MTKRTKRKPGDPGPISISLPMGSPAAQHYVDLERLMIDRMGVHNPSNVQVASMAFLVLSKIMAAGEDEVLALICGPAEGKK